MKYFRTVLFSIISCICIHPNVWGTNYGTNVVVSSNVYISFSSNYDYYARTRAFQYAHWAQALNFIRQQQVHKGQMKDVPIYFNVASEEGPAPAVRKALSVKEDCLMYWGEGAGYSIGECYQITISTGTDYSEFRASAFPNVPTESSRIELD